MRQITSVGSSSEESCMFRVFFNSDSAVATASEAAPAKAAPKKRAAKKPAKAAKKKGTKKVAKGAKKVVKRKDGLRLPQVKILQTLAKYDRSLSRKEIAEKSGVDLAMMNSYIGSSDDKVRAKNDKQVCMSLLTLGAIKADVEEGVRGTVYNITASGKKALEASKK